MTIFQNDGTEAWSILHRSLTQLAGGEPRGAVVQPLGISERADWDTTNQPLNWYRELRIANQVPTWNPLYFPNTGVGVPDEYQAFLDQLNSRVISASGAADQQALRQADRERSIAQERLMRSEAHVNSQWDRYVASHGGRPPLSRGQWEADFGFASVRENLRRLMTVALAAFMRLVNDAGGELLEVGRALAAMSDLGARVALPQDEQEATMDAANWQRWYRANLGDDLFNFLRDEIAGSIVLHEQAQRTTRFHDRWGASGGFSWFGVFGLGGGESNETIQRRSEEDTNRIEIKFKNLQTFPITRGQWFKGGLISQFRDRMPEPFWGEGGRLNLIPATITLIRGVRIDVHTSSQVSEYFFNKRVLGGRAGFRFGPFRIGGSGSRVTSHEETSFDRTDFGFVVEDKSERAQILAVTSIRHADLLARPEDAVPAFRRMNAEELREGVRLLHAMRADAEGGLEKLIQ